MTEDKTEKVTSDKTPSEQQDDRKPYIVPLLITHGTIQELTQAHVGPPTDGNQAGVVGSAAL
jgi:hypothetical protein